MVIKHMLSVYIVFEDKLTGEVKSETTKKKKKKKKKSPNGQVL